MKIGYATTGVSGALPLLTLLAACWPTSVFAGPDISNRTFINYPEYSTHSIAGVFTEAVTTDGVWTALGSPMPRLTHGHLGLFEELAANSVRVTGPWDGNPYFNPSIAPPAQSSWLAEEFGAALSLQGDRIAVGSPAEWAWSMSDHVCFYHAGGTPIYCQIGETWVAGGGKVHLYSFNGSRFQPERIITNGGIDDRFGHAVALESGTLLAGSPGTVPGSAHLFDPDSGTYITSFTSPDPQGLDGYGTLVALDGDLALVSAPLADTVYVYRDDGNGDWSAAGTLTSPSASSEFGAAIAADGGHIVVGAPGLDKAYIFEDTGTSNWPVVAQLDSSPGIGFGTSVAITGDTVWVSATNFLYGPLRLGAVGQYDQAPDGTWLYTTNIYSSNPINNNRFGSQIAASDRILTVLAQGERGMHVLTSPTNIYDPEGDGHSSLADNCFDIANADQSDLDGDVCDDDIDGDTLSNDDEIALGTDPSNPDTDADGLPDNTDPDPLSSDIDADGVADGADNCPLDANMDQADLDNDQLGDVCDGDIDGDDLSNTEELALGSDPYNPDTDGDGTEDGSDDYLLDFNDGWDAVYRFPLGGSIYDVAVGDDVVLAVSRNKAAIFFGWYGQYLKLSAYASTPDGWQPAPTLPISLPGPGFYRDVRVAMKGNRVAIHFNNVVEEGPTVATGHIMLFEWGTAGDWTLLNSIETTGLSDMRGLAMSGDIIAGYNPNTLRIYENTPEGLVLVAERPVSSSSSIDVSGETVMVGSYYNIRIYEKASAYTEELISSPRYGAKLFTNDLDKFFTSSGVRAGWYWVEKVDGIWELTPESIDFNFDVVGPRLKVGVEVIGSKLDVRRIDDGSVLGEKIQPRASIFATNGRVVVHNGNNMLNIIPLDVDDDGVGDDLDNCPDVANADQADADGDGIGNVCDGGSGC